MGSQVAHAIELMSVPQLQQCMSYSEWEPNSAVLSGWDQVPEPSRGAHSHPNPAPRGQRHSACGKRSFSSIPDPARVRSCAGKGLLIPRITNYQEGREVLRASLPYKSWCFLSYIKIRQPEPGFPNPLFHNYLHHLSP